MKLNHIVTPAMVAVLLLASGLADGAECLLWIKRTDVGSYGQRWRHAMAYDPDRGVTVFFGGEIGNGEDVVYFNDTQEYDGKQWKQISTAVKPPPRSSHAMAYDPVRKKIVLFGGYYSDFSNPGFGFYRIYNDTWVYTGDGINGFWEQVQDTNAPQAYHHGMVWDSFNKVVLMHHGKTWWWNGTNWMGTLSGPTFSEFGMAFDTERGMAMIAGGFNNPTANFWEKEPTNGWKDRGSGPSVRAQLAMAYDERRKRVVMVGGVGDSIETGETAYEYAPGKGWLIIPSLPSGQGRAGARMVYDSKRGVMVLTGGAGGGAPNAGDGGRYSDTWELWPSLYFSGQPTDATNEVCTIANFATAVYGVEPMQFTWRRDGAPLTDDEHYSGTSTPELRIAGVRHGHAGKYDLVVKDNCDPQNVITSRVATLTVQPESEWVLRATNGPPPRWAHGMAYDSKRHVTVLFGGRTNTSAMVPFNDLWEWDGGRWTQRLPNTISNGWRRVPGVGWRVSHTDRPVRRADFGMAYDSRRGRVVIFGGWGKAPDGSDATFRDLWEWDGIQWYFRATNGPIARFYCSMAYDERRGRTVLYGGWPVPAAGSSEVADADLVWEWDGYNWHSNQPPVSPSGANYRTQARMVYDDFRGVTVFGPTYESYSHWSFWDWDGVQWTNTPVLHYSDPVVTVLHGTSLGGFAFDSNRRRSVWFGGQNSTAQNKTALYDGHRWTLLTNSSSPPPPRTTPAMAYDSDRRAIIMFGGNLLVAGAEATNDTWELAAVDAPVINEHPASQFRLAGETSTFHVKAAGHGFVGYQWLFENTPIEGARGETLTISNVRAQDVGEYKVVVTSACGSTTSRAAKLSLNERLQIFSSGDKATMLWAPAPGMILETADEIIGPWTIIEEPPIPFNINTLGPGKFFRTRPPFF